MSKYLDKLLSLLIAFIAGLLYSEHTSSKNGNFQTNDRLVGGSGAHEGQLLYQVSLHYRGNHVCGGSFISEDWILTAAHCFTEKDVNPKHWEVIAGSLKHNEEIRHTVSYIPINPQYNDSVKDGDIAVIKVEMPFQFRDTIKCDPQAASGDDPRPGEKAIISGWGYREENGSTSDRLQFAEIMIISRNECCEIYTNFVITDNMICAGEISDGKTSCQGDSGGPLVIDGVQHGIVSFGIGCGNDIPGVYTRVGALREFIKEHTGL